ncbi:Immunoglobulin I-set domain family protein [Acanthocheilonema viteae]
MNDRQQLHIESATDQDAGRYSCVAENKPGRAEKDLIVAVLKPPQMDSQHRVFELPENETITLTCPINDPSVEIQWTKNGIPITTSNNLQLSTSGLKLHILHGQLYDAGRYVCRAWNDAGEAIAHINVVVLVPPKIIGSAFRTIESVLNQTVNIECKRTGIPTPKNTWSFNGRTIFPSEKIQILNNGTLLILKEIQANQEGRYSCTATNKVGRAEADTFLQIIAPPKILTSIDELKVIQGQGQTIRCEMSGTPTPKVEWLKNGQRFNATMAQSSSNLHYIHLRETQVSDAGRYTCIARNRAGEHRMTTQLYVLVPPLILEGERVVQVKENATVTLECIASGNPKPIVVWKRDGRLLDIRGSRFVIKSSKASDGGRYTCEARNEAGKVSTDFEVDIFIKPRFRDLKAEIRVRNGERARLECKVDGHPEPIITWMRGGRPIEDMKNIILSPRGETMMILKSRRADSGSYSCVAKNFAGEAEASFTVTVLIAPHIDEQIDQNLRVVQGTKVIMHCPVQGNPKPKIKWLYNEKPIKIDRAKIIDETDLVIEKSKQYDSGRYTCFAENEAGILNTNYELEIIGPPKFHHRGETVYEVIVGKTVTMDCDVEAEPKPEIYWLRGDSPLYFTDKIHISPNRQQITIRNVEMSDGGKYTCKTKNEAGSADIDLTLKVLVPPSIDTSNIIGNPLAVVGKSIYLECPVSGIPRPSVIWYKDGILLSTDNDRFVIEQNNQTFGIKEVKVSDKGQFLCVVENKGGRVEQGFNLEVLVPPKLETVESQKYTKREKDSMTLYCPIKHDEQSTTPTEILWYKDGRPIDGVTVPKIKITSKGQRLHITRMSLADSGNYSCVALNRAGESSLDFYVEILSAPHLDYSRNEQQPHVIAGRPITLWCMVSGYPLPTIRWMKDGYLVPINKKSDIRLVENGQGLEILEAKREHAGIWTCEASNAAGKTDYELTLDVWTLPIVSIQPVDNVRPIDSVIIIHCQATGNPEPSLSWSKDGQPLITSANGARISLKGTRLDIPRLKQSHVGEYTCTAVNEVGTSSATVHIDVLVPPVINRDNIEMSPRLPTAQTLTLICDATGKPLPEIFWYVNDTMVRETTSNVIIGENGRYLQVKDIALNNRGAYKCIASNIAGKDELLYTVTIVQAPKILNGGSYQVIEGKEAQILCNVIGEPQPVVTWQRNGIHIETGMRHIIEDKILRIMDTRSSDSGLYVCVATNEAGTAQQAFTLEVFVIPRIITMLPNESLIPVGKPFSLKCGVRGFPPPDIIWSLNGEILGKDKTSYSIAEDGTLFVEKATKQAILTFKCVAKNNAGSDSKEFIVKVISPPVLIKEGIKTINATEGDPSLLICEIEGEIPEIYWYKDNKPLILTSNIELSSDRTQLKIHHSKLHDEGMYSCIAVNPAGNATQKQQLYVGVPPRITEKPRRIIVKSGQAAELWCEAVGIPKPHITWLKDDKALSQTALDDYTDVLKSTAFFPNVSSKDGGVYTCKAENWAGISYKDVDLVVLIPPEIHPERLNITANIDDTVILTCNITGVPEPVVSWVKMPNVDIIGNEKKYQIYGTALHIRNVVPEDDGFYHCVAKSNAGQVIGSRRLTVIDPRKDYKVIWVECGESGQPIKTTYVPARGDVPEGGNNLLPWKQDLQDLPQNGTNGILIRCLPESRGIRRASLAMPRFIRSPRTQKVLPGTVANLHCSAIGQPKPYIIWIRNGAFLTGMSQSSVGHSILQVKVESNDDLGDYICLAQNTVGSVTSIATLFLDQITEKAQKRSIAMLNCVFDNAVPKKNVIWKFFNTQLSDSSTETVNLLRNGSLIVYDVTESNLTDLFGYQCYTTNGKQTTEINFLKVEEDVPRVQVSPKQVFVNLNESLILNCKLLPNPLTAVVQWTKNDVKLTDSNRTRMLVNNSLHITKLLLSDRAIFKCIASNRYGKSYDDVQVIVKSLAGVINKVKGIVNGRRLKRETTLITVKPKMEANVITMNSIFREQGVIEEIMLGYMMMAFPQLAFNANQKNSLASVEFHRVIDYRFESGEIMRVYQKGFGMDGEYAQFEIAFNGRVPHFNDDTYSWIDQAKEEMVEQEPGMIRGNGLAILRVGNQANIPFHWNESIVYDASRGMDIGPGRSVTFKFALRKAVCDDVKLNIMAKTESVRRICPIGYHSKDGTCIDINECESSREICHKQANCINTIGDYSCMRNCPSGFKAGPQGDCEDIDECTLGIHNCTDGVLCMNRPGTFLCETSLCADGYVRDSNGHCKDIDECAESLCGSLECLNHLGSYSCICPTGFPADSIGHCEELQTSLTDLKLIRFDENWNVCEPGYYRINETCQDINECVFNFPCKYECENIEGSYKCLCPKGYRVEQNNCTDINECLYDPCSENELCFNQLGSYECLATPCPTDYHLEDQKCMPNCKNCSNSPIIIYTISVPKSIPPLTPLLRLTAYDHRSKVLHRTRFIMKSISKFTKHIPFIFKTKNGRATLQNAEDPLEAGTYKLAIRSISKLPYRARKLLNDFIVFISVSEYDF